MWLVTWLVRLLLANLEKINKQSRRFWFKLFNKVSEEITRSRIIFFLVID